MANTTPASVSRFSKKIEYANFLELKNDTTVFNNNHLLDLFPLNSSFNDLSNLFLEHSIQTDKLIFNQFDELKITTIAEKCKHSKKIAIISNSYFLPAANLFRELLSQQGITILQINRNASEDIIKNIIETCDLVFIISLTGDWVQTTLFQVTAPHFKKIIVITFADLEEHLLSLSILSLFQILILFIAPFTIRNELLCSGWDYLVYT